MTVTSGWRGKLAVFLPSILVVLLVLFEGTQRFAIGSTADYVAPFWFKHFGSLPYQRFWEFVEALRKLGHLAGYGLVCLAFWGYLLLEAGPAAWTDRLGTEEPGGRLGAGFDYAAGLGRRTPPEVCSPAHQHHHRCRFRCLRGIFCTDGFVCSFAATKGARRGLIFTYLSSWV